MSAMSASAGLTLSSKQCTVVNRKAKRASDPLDRTQRKSLEPPADSTVFTTLIRAERQPRPSMNRLERSTHPAANG